MENELKENVEPLNRVEQSRRAELEYLIKSNIRAASVVYESLMEIRDKRLYRDAYLTFADYCQSEWSLDVRSAYRKIKNAEVNKRVGNSSKKPNESQANELSKAPEDKQKDVWDKVTKDGEPTANKVKNEVEKISKPSSNKKTSGASNIVQRKVAYNILCQLTRTLKDMGCYYECEDELGKVLEVIGYKKG